MLQEERKMHLIRVGEGFNSKPLFIFSLLFSTQTYAYLILNYDFRIVLEDLTAAGIFTGSVDDMMAVNLAGNLICRYIVIQCLNT